jgi:hypothetical protein
MLSIASVQLHHALVALYRHAFLLKTGTPPHSALLVFSSGQYIKIMLYFVGANSLQLKEDGHK